MDDKRNEIRSEEVQDLMGQVPSWIIRWGTVLIVFVVILFIGGSWIFKYPDVIISKVMITTQIPPAGVVARSTGKIDKIFIKDKEQVEKDQVLAVIQNPAKYSDVLELEKKLDSLSGLIRNNDEPVIIQFNEYYELGDIQTVYTTFLKLYEDYMHFVDLNYHAIKIQSLNDKINRLNVYYGQLFRQKSVLENELAIAQIQLERNKSLLDKDIISLSAYEKFQSIVLEKQYAVEKAVSELASTKIQIQEVEQHIIDLKLSNRDDKGKIQINLAESYENLKSEIRDWKHKFLIVSPVAGTITMTTIWSENQNITAGEQVFTVIPDQTDEMIGKCTLPIRGSGKVKEGQVVNLKFDNYPYMEYGIVKGKISSISLVPANNYFMVEVKLPEGLKTSYKKELAFSQEMSGFAEIITEEVRLFDRMFNPVKSFLSERVKANS